MRPSRRTAAIFVSILVLLLVGGLGAVRLASPETASGLQWRGRLIALKYQGALPDLSWSEIVRTLGPARMRPLKSKEAVKMAMKGNIYQSIRNPSTSPADVAAGAQLFRSQCAACHGLDGSGGTGPNLTHGRFRRGGSDLALFRTISRGVPGSPMEGFNLPEESIWQVVAFLRSLSQEAEQTNLVEDVSERGSFNDAMLPRTSVTYERLRRADEEPHNWLTYSGTYNSHRYSPLTQINRNNIEKLKLQWVVQLPTIESKVQTTPLVVDGIMYLTEPPNNVYALDAATGQPLWTYERELPEGQLPLCCGRVNRGLAVLGERLYLGTLDAHLVALDAKTGAVIWDVKVADHSAGYSITGAPLAVQDKIITGIAGGEYGVRGFLDAYNATTGERVWRFYTIPEPGEPGHETWAGDSWQTGGGPTWLTGSFDPELNLIYWGVGNPGPPFNGERREGDNLYSNCVIALDADTGQLRWHFQFTPHDEYDFDAVQIPVLVDAEFQGRQRKLMLWANRNAFFYVLDRASGEFLLAREFVKQTWAEGIDTKGRPIRRPESSPSPEGTLVRPGRMGATNWWSPSYSPSTGLLYIPITEAANLYFNDATLYTPGWVFMGGAIQGLPQNQGWGGVRALIAQTGQVKWEHNLQRTSEFLRPAGILSTAGNLVFMGNSQQFFALDAETGKELWRFRGGVIAAPITYLSQDRQQITIAVERAIFTFGLDE